MLDEFDAVVIGAGVIGLAVTRALSRSGLSVLLIERHSTFGTEISARNSEVIHGGLYYPRSSLKTRLCIEGRRSLYDYCERHDIAHKRCGKLVTATTDGEVGALQALAGRARENGVEGMVWLEQAEVRRLEPELRAKAALHSTCTGIISSHELMTSLLGEAEAAGAMVVFNTPFVRARFGSGGWIIETGQDEVFEVFGRTLINCAGLSAAAVAARAYAGENAQLPATYLAKGNYYSLTRPSPFSHLIYPLPVDGGLGVHLTLDIAGRAKFGPDVEWIEEIDYTVSGDRIEEFLTAIRAYYPAVARDDLQPDYAGIRPKLTGPGADFADFMFQGPESHGMPGLVNLFGIESPGLTACLAIADHVARLCGVRPAGDGTA